MGAPSLKFPEMLWPFRQLPTQYVVLDTETTGLPDKHGDTDLVSVGLAVVSDCAIEASFEFLVKPTRRISEEALGVHKIKQERADHFEPFKNVAKNITDVLNGKLIVIHNASFDWPILCEHYTRYKIVAPQINGIFCSQKSAFPWALANKIKCSERGPSLDTLSTLLEVKSLRDERGSHGAEIDALQTAGVVEHLRVMSRSDPKNLNDPLQI